MVLLCAGMGAQNLSDALTYGGVEYTGTARSMALSGAVGALGCDLGSISINPAGSAVAGFSQIVFTPSYNVSALQSAYSQGDGSFGSPRTGNKGYYHIPNFGYSTRYENYDGGSCKSMTFAVVYNATAEYSSDIAASGNNALSSRFAEMAHAAGGIDRKFLGSSGFYDDYNFGNYWDVGMGYMAGLINSYGSGNDYVGCTEVLTTDGTHYVPGTLSHIVHNQTDGYKGDLLLNMAFNFSDTFYLGMTLGMPMLSYSFSEYWSEASNNPDLFPVQLEISGSTMNTTFNEAAYQYDYHASGTGVYLKVGAIWLPTESLRLGLALQTPTAMSISESWLHSGRVSYTIGAKYSSSSRTGFCDYNYYSPAVVDFSAAYTFGRYGLISVDYTLLDYNGISYTDEIDDDTPYEITNMAMREFVGVQHYLRAGAELNLGGDFSIRAGYSLTTNPEKYYTHAGDIITVNDYDEDYYFGRKELPLQSSYYSDLIQNYSCGLGYHPVGPYYFDLAVRYKALPESVYRPYGDYAGIAAPVIRSVGGYWSAALTFGVRF